MLESQKPIKEGLKRLLDPCFSQLLLPKHTPKILQVFTLRPPYKVNHVSVFWLVWTITVIINLFRGNSWNELGESEASSGSILMVSEAPKHQLKVFFGVDIAYL